MKSISKTINKIGKLFIKNDSNSEAGIREGSEQKSILIEKGVERDLYRTRFGDFFWLNKESYLDQSIINTGIWEDATTAAIRSLVKKGDIVLDIGANIGYDTVIMSKIIGDEGIIYSFEPTDYYSKVLEKNIKANDLKNCEVVKVGLSDKQESLKIEIGSSSATIHVPDNIFLKSSEQIELDTLENFVREKNLERIDFIKMDIDGHEPLVLEGGWNVLEKFNPMVLLEVNHLNYLEAGYNAWDFYQTLVSKGYRIYSEDNLNEEITNRSEFLKKCGNFAYSANIVISKDPINT